jgi:anti-sigma-K factor RskA
MNDELRCDEIDELAGAIALGALDVTEMSMVEAHLAGCEKHPEIASLFASAHALALTAPPMEPPPELKTRLMAAIEADLAAENSSAQAFPAQPAAEERRGLLERLFGGPRIGFGFAAAAVAVAVLLLVISPWGGGGDDEDTIVRSFDDGNISAEVTYDPNQESTFMTVEGLDPAPEGSVYQVWAVTGGNPVSIGFLEVPDDGAVTTDMEGVELVDGQVVAVTLEPAGGSPLPTTEPIFGIEI